MADRSESDMKADRRHEFFAKQTDAEFLAKLFPHRRAEYAAWLVRERKERNG